MRAAITRYAGAFGRFWWEFLVGDTPEIFLGTLAVIAAALLLRHERAVGFVAVPLVALGVLVASTLRGRRRA